jgi:uncharacterized protein
LTQSAEPAAPRGWVVVTADLWRTGIAARTIAVVAARRDDTTLAHTTPAYLQTVGYRIVPVIPTAVTILGRRAHPSLASVSDQVDGVRVIRPADEAAAIARDVVAIGAGVHWLQQGLRSAAARKIASAAGIGGLEDTCLGTQVASVPDFPTPLES